MKRCPTCEKTFDDNLRFCQADGTPLLDAEEELDPYKTMVAKPGEIAAALGASKPPAEAASEDSVLELPDEPDPNKTQFVSEKELRDEMAAADKPVVDLPSDPPKFSEPEPPSAPRIGGPPPSPFDQPQSASSGAPDKFSQTSPPIPSPFGGGSGEKKEEPAMPKFEAPEPPKFDEPAKDEPAMPQFSSPEPQEPKFDPFEPQAPTAPPAMMQQQERPSMSPPPPMGGPVGQMGGSSAAPAAGGQNKTLALVSLIAGILSLCCWISPLTGLVAVITGFMGMKKANNDPANYGGKGMAIAGLILGALFFLLGIAYWIFILFFNGLAMLQNMQNM
jgi:uncharacterized membrane protein